MGAGFCNLNSLEWLTEKPLTPTRLCEQRSNQSHRVGREEEGLTSNRPELVDLRECLETHPDHENLLYLTDSEAALQVINKWIGGGAKLSLTKTADADILRVIIVKLQRSSEGEGSNPVDQGESTSWMPTQWRGGHSSRDGTDEARTGEDVEHVNQQNHLPMVGGLQN